MKTRSGHSRKIQFGAVLLLLLMWGEMLLSASKQSPVVDEPYHITNGYVYLTTGDLRLRHGNPLLPNLLAALPLLSLGDDIHLPTDHPAWAEGDWAVFGQQFLWQANGALADRIVFLARLPIMGLALLLGVILFRWGREWGGPLTGLTALGLYVLCPNILAHASLATSDLAVTAFFLLTVYLLQRYLTHGHPLWMIGAGLALGLALGSKFSAFALPPMLLLLALIAWLPRERGAKARPFFGVLMPWWLAAAAAWLGVMLVGLLSLWAIYGFEIAPLPDGGPGIPLSTYLQDLRWQLVYNMQIPHSSFLMGRISTSGWWYYLPVTLLIKTPLPLLLGLILAMAVTIQRRAWRQHGVLILPVAVFLALSLGGGLERGYRYILPILPFLHLYVGQAIAPRTTFHVSRLAQVAVAFCLLIWYVWRSLGICPHYLAYFNELAGGPGGGHRFLVDSNIDWGQDLPALKTFLDRQGISEVRLSYFGSTPPSHYSIPFAPLPTWEAMPERGDPARYAFYPQNPSPGWYAISVTNLQGVFLTDPDTFAWFRGREPDARLGYSIYLYHVPAEGAPVGLGLSGLGMNHIAPDDYALLATNDVRPRWFDARYSLVLPAEETAWLLIAAETPFDPALAAALPAPEPRPARAYTAYRLPGGASICPAKDTAAPVWWSPATAFPPTGFERHALALPVNLGPVALTGYTVNVQDSDLTLLTCWRVEASERRDLKIFVHLLDEAGQLVTGQDRLEVPTAGWREGDIFVQIHRLTWPADAPAATYQLELGWYDSQTLARLPIFDGAAGVADRLLLQPATLK